MKSILKGAVFKHQNVDYPIYPKRSGHYVNILEGIHQQMSAMISHHSRITVIWFTIRCHNYTEDSKWLSRLIEKLKRALKRKYKMNQIGHTWAREQETSDTQHYHTAFMLDGNKVRRAKEFINRLQKMCDEWGLPVAWIPDNCYYQIDRGDNTAFANCFKRLAYCAKVKGKGKKGITCNDYSTSRVKLLSKCK